MEAGLYAGKVAFEGFVDSVAKKAEGVVRSRWEERKGEVESVHQRILQKRAAQRSGGVAAAAGPG